jgi:tRNA threonylcarbamoyladenosine biosynthesis protein TsaE
MALTLERHDTPPNGPIVGTAHWRTEADAQAMAAALSQAPGIASGRIVLTGDLGAGKTTFVRHLLRGLGVTGPIKSPTYAVLEPHLAHAAQGGFDILHFDCYRFQDPQEWEDAGFREQWDGPGLKLCEWPQRVPGLCESADWHIDIQTDPSQGREVRIQALTALGASWMNHLQA